MIILVNLIFIRNVIRKVITMTYKIPDDIKYNI